VVITGLENLKNMFSIFHDGCILNYEVREGNLVLEVEIQYLAQRISNKFKCFQISLENVEDLSFSPWYDDPSDKRAITTVEKIFTPELEILSAETEGKYLKIACNQPLPNLGYCGGDLYLKTSSALITDEANKSYSISELTTLCSEYWKEWRNKNKT